MSYENPEDIEPSYVPQYPEWPNNDYHDDWPKGRNYMMNDSEYACEGTFDPGGCNCEPDPPEECLCVTSADAERWNSYSALEPLSGLDVSTINALSGLDPEALSACVSAVEENAPIWMSAEYVPNIYANISALYNNLNNKVEISALEAITASGINVESTYFFGNGTENSVLRPSWLTKSAIETIRLATHDFKIPLTNAEISDQLKKDINQLSDGEVAISASLYKAWDEINILAKVSGGNAKYESAEDVYTTGGIDAVIAESKTNPDTFYYYTTK